MAITSVKNIIKYNKHNEKYEHSRIIFPSKDIYLILKRIDSSLRPLYSKDRTGGKINYSTIRDSYKNINLIFNKVEERLNSIEEPVDLILLWEAAFTYQFPGIYWFLNEAQEIKHQIKSYYKNVIPYYSKLLPSYFKETIISLADKMWVLGIRPIVV